MSEPTEDPYVRYWRAVAEAERELKRNLVIAGLLWLCFVIYISHAILK